MNYVDIFKTEVKRLEKGASHKDAINQLTLIVKSADEEIENLELQIDALKNEVPSNKVYLGITLCSSIFGYLIGALL